MMHLDPNLPALVVSVSFVYESNAGFSMRQLTKTWSYCLIWKFLIFNLSFLCFFLTS